ncbi:MAG: PTS sugar transporter subunit IIA [Ignavibacteria bacterium]|nr:PTS sugar transporter subunit IIA [Ignavibacteria bacterium]
MKVSDILSENVIAVNLKAADKTESINKMIDLANKSGKILNLEKVKECVFEREKLVSTGVGKAFAIPHGKTDEITDIVGAFSILESPIDFESIDNEKVKFIFLLIGKDALLNAHIKLLSRISRLMNKDGFREKLLTAKNSEEVLKLFREEEMGYIDI